MEAPANNPFGAPSNPGIVNPFGAPVGSGQQTSVFSQPPPARNPFGAPSQPSNPFGATSPAQTSAFGSLPSSAFQSQASSRQPSPTVQVNPFGNTQAQARSASPFAASATNGSRQAASSFTSQPRPGGVLGEQSVFGTSNANSMARSGKNSTGSKNGFGGHAQKNGDASQNGPFKLVGRKSPAEQPSHDRPMEVAKKLQPGPKRNNDQQERAQTRIPNKVGGQSGPTKEPSERTKQLSPFAYGFANNIYDRLRKDNLKTPQWPAELGNPNKRGAVEALKDAYKKYRVRVYESLRKAEIIDDPEKKRRLADALPFKGICEDMCPEFEKISRIAEHDVKTEEKEVQPDGLTMWANPSKMVKKFGRSAAGQDAPLPQDVRSVDALRRTTDYLFNDLLQSDNNLPSMHNFLWDRTRAVRRDFTFHSQKSAEEMRDLVYCFETITRFHATALHLLSRKGFAQEDFDFKQEIEQLGRTILSLMEAYDACREKKVHCENEPEFRAYYLLLNVHDPSIGKRIPTWGKEYWFESEEIQTAMSLIQAMEDVREPKGPIKPRRGTTLSDTAFTNYFAIVEDPKVSYTMACIAEIHFTTVRQNVLRNLVKGYARFRDAPRTISASDLNRLLRFDTPEEAVEFAEAHNFELSSEHPKGKAAPPAPYLLLNDKRKTVPSPRITQSFSGQLVERKRGAQSLPFIIYNTIFEEPRGKPKDLDNRPDSLFVSQPAPTSEILPTPIATQPHAASLATSSFGFPTKDTASSLSPLAGTTTQPAITATPSLFSVPSKDPPEALVAKNPFAIFSQPSLTQPLALASNQPTTKLGSVSHQTQPPSTTSKPADILSPPSVQGSSSSQPIQPVTSFFPGLPPAVNKDASKTPSFFSAPPHKALTSKVGPVESVRPALPTTASTPLGLTPLPAASNLLTTPNQPGALGPAHGVPSTIIPKPTAPVPNAPSVGPAQGTRPSVRSPATGAVPAPAAPRTLAPAPASLTMSPLPGSSHAPSQPQQSILFGHNQPSALGPLAPPPPPRDLMGDLAKWFVLGDGGLMEQFTDFTVQEIVAQAFEQFQSEEEEKKRKAEEELSWREARQFRTYSLGVRYFYKWQEVARARATQRILAQGKEKMRVYREQERVARQKAKEDAAKAEREAKKETQRRIEADGQHLSFLASTGRMRRSGTEEQLLASGIFSGIRDERGAARRVMRDVQNGTGWGNHRYADSDLVLEPRRQSISTQGGQGGTPDSSLSKKEGWKTRSLREKFGLQHRRSTSAGSSIYSTSKLRQSLPAPKKTNFSRKRSADETSDEERESKRKPANPTSAFKTNHWDMRARGFVPMPNGQWLPESVAKAMRDGKRFEGLGDGGLGPGKEVADYRPSDCDFDAAVDGNDDGLPTALQLRLARLRRPTIHGEPGYTYRSRSPSGSYFASTPPPVGKRDGSPGKRKREAEEDDGEEGSSPSVTKRSHISRQESQAMVENVQKMVRELKEAMDKLDEDRVLFQEQSGVLGDGS